MIQAQFLFGDHDGRVLAGPDEPASPVLLGVMDVKISQPVRARRPAGPEAQRPPGVSRPCLRPPKQSPAGGRALGRRDVHRQCWGLQPGLPRPPSPESPPPRAEAPWTPPAHLPLWSGGTCLAQGSSPPGRCSSGASQRLSRTHTP